MRRMVAALMSIACFLFLGCTAGQNAPDAFTPLPSQALLESAAASVANNRVQATEVPDHLTMVLPADTQEVACEAQASVSEGFWENIQQEPSGEVWGKIQKQLQDCEQSVLEQGQIDADTAFITYCCMYQSDTVVSILIEAQDQQGNMAMRPITLDCQTGEQCRLSDFFITDDTTWRGVLADLVSDAAIARGITLLNEVPPVQDDQLFYLIEGGNIVLLYRPYEITTYQAEFPCFVLPMESLRKYTTGAYGIGAQAAEPTEEP